MCRSVGPAENGEEISLLNERMLQAALQGAWGVGWGCAANRMQ